MHRPSKHTQNTSHQEKVFLMTQIQELISQMTLEEKAALCSGLDFWYTKPIDRLGIPSIMVADGPHGLRKEREADEDTLLADSLPATCFPTASALAATWDRDLVHQVGQALAEECLQEGVSVILGPGANIKRSPLCGRNFEYFSEDPYLSGQMAKSHINGVQSKGVGASLKHFAVNNQEYRRMTINAVVDDRALREIYLAGFEIAVREAQPWTVMCAYNRLNGTYCCENPMLLNETLKEEWGHEGLVVTDWGAMNERAAALKAGTELEMPGTNRDNDRLIVEAVQSGKLDEAVLDAAVTRLLKMILKGHQNRKDDDTYDPDAHHALARRAAAEAAVLLKNEGPVLPLKKDVRVALVGAFAKHPRYQGAGSSAIVPTRLDTLYDALTAVVGEGQLSYAPGYTPRGLEMDQRLIDEAVAAAKGADVVVVCAGLPDIFETEGLDRTHMRMPESHNRLIEAVAAVHDRVVVVLSNGSPVEMPWLDQVQAVLEGYLGGQAGGSALADVLFGAVNPCGKLAETFPLRLEDNPSHGWFPGGPKTVEYRESLYVGYRFYDTVGKEVLFPFGFGLSYTRFAYENLRLSAEQISDTDTLTVTLTVRNTGDLPGKEIVQLYVKPEAPTAFRPEKELKAFEKVALQPGEAKDVTLSLGRRAFAHFNTGINNWGVESGAYQILVGASSRQIHLQGKVTVKSTQEAPIPARDRLPAYTRFPVDASIGKADFETLLGRPLPDNAILKGETATLNTPIIDMQHAFAARRLYKTLSKQVQEMISDDPESPHAKMIAAMMADAPLRTLMLLASDRLNRATAEALLLLINRRFFKGLAAILRARRKKSSRDK